MAEQTNILDIFNSLWGLWWGFAPYFGTGALFIAATNIFIPQSLIDEWLDRKKRELEQQRLKERAEKAFDNDQ